MSTENETMWERLLRMPCSFNLRDCIFISAERTRQTRDKKCVAFLNHSSSDSRGIIIERENVISLFKCSLENLCLFISLHGFMYNDPTCVQRPFSKRQGGKVLFWFCYIFYAWFCAVEASGNAFKPLRQESEKYDSLIVGKRILLVAWSEKQAEKFE